MHPQHTGALCSNLHTAQPHARHTPVLPSPPEPSQQLLPVVRLKGVYEGVQPRAAEHALYAVLREAHPVVRHAPLQTVHEALTACCMHGPSACHTPGWATCVTQLGRCRITAPLPAKSRLPAADISVVTLALGIPIPR